VNATMMLWPAATPAPPFPLLVIVRLLTAPPPEAWEALPKFETNPATVRKSLLRGTRAGAAWTPPGAGWAAFRAGRNCAGGKG